MKASTRMRAIGSVVLGLAALGTACTNPPPVVPPPPPAPDYTYMVLGDLCRFTFDTCRSISYTGTVTNGSGLGTPTVTVKAELTGIRDDGTTDVIVGAGGVGVFLGPGSFDIPAQNAAASATKTEYLVNKESDPQVGLNFSPSPYKTLCLRVWMISGNTVVARWPGAVNDPGAKECNNRDTGI